MKNGSEILVTTNNNQNKLKDILKKISQQYKWTINVEQQLSDQTIKGIFIKEPFESFLRRTLKNKNIITTYNRDARTIDILSFGSKSSSRFIIIGTDIPSPVGDNTLYGLNEDIPVADKETAFYDPNAVEPITGISQSEIARIEAEENAAYDSFINDPNAREPLTGISLEDIAQIHNIENITYTEYVTNPNAVEPLTGVSLREINTIQKHEDLLYKRNVNNPYTLKPLAN
jgi:hypothetical protein